MKLRHLLAVGALAACVSPGGHLGAAGCDPDGKVKFICGMIAPEDLISVPRTDWVIASGYTAGGAIHLVNARDFTTRQLFPSASPRVQLDGKTYSSCPGPIDPAEKEKFSAHGLNLRPGASGVHTVYVVHHGLRESVEIFEIDSKPTLPTFTWVGCVVAPKVVSMNSVSPVPGGGFVVTNIMRQDIPNLQERMRSGGNTGELWEWTPSDGWKAIPESEAPLPNGIEVSKDGKWYFVNLWSTGRVMRMSRGQSPVKKDFVNLDFRPDNIRWQADGSLYAAGQGASTPERVQGCLNKYCADATTNVVRIDPQTLKVTSLVRDSNKEAFVSSTVGLRVGKEIWIGTSHSDRVARYPVE